MEGKHLDVAEITAVADDIQPSERSFLPEQPTTDDQEEPPLAFRRRLKQIIWDTLDYTLEERRFVSKIDFFILTWAGFSYFSKNLNSNNLSNAYVSGMREEINVVGNQYQTFTTMWTM
ncbi:hypothetical protein V1515DRAFT_306972 [Lipomyces mesembrius]